MKTNVMIFAGGGHAAQQIHAALKYSLRYHPILASSNDNHSTFVSEDAISDLPYDSDPGFVDALNQCIHEHDVRFIIPSHDTAALVLMQNADKIDATVVCSPMEATLLCRYKSKTYEALAGLDFVPKTYQQDDENIEFPVFAKDDAGQGGKNAFKINCKEEFAKLDTNTKYVICEYLPGDEITIDCFTDRHGALRFVQPRKRARLLNGISARAEFVELTEEIAKIAHQISQRIRFRGYWFIQCRKDANGAYKLMEISTRFAGTFALSKNLDVNLPLLAVEDFAEREIEIIPNPCNIILDKGYIDRYKFLYDYQRVYIDFDDTLVFQRSMYNTEAMRFLYQCLNGKKEIILITKHAYDLRETAKNIKLDLNLFDKIIEVPVGEPKYKYMESDVPAIFIDNAFAERKLVKTELHIPTFDVTNIECLIDYTHL